MTGEIVVVTTTLPAEWTEQQVTEFANSCILANLSACVQWFKINSTYQWQGEVNNEEEWRLEFKTSKSQHFPLISHIESEHPYDVPQIIIHHVDATDGYSKWVEETTK